VNAPLVAHVVYSLGTGGLENGMINIINRIPPDRFRHVIICIKESGDFANRITDPGVRVIELGKREGHDLGFYWRLWKTLLQLRPAIVHTRNIAAIEAQFFVWLIPGVRGVHGEHGRDIYDVAGENRKYRMLRRILSPFIGRFIAVSKDLAQWLKEDVGISAEKIVHIYNGVDLERFAPGLRSKPVDYPREFFAEGAVVVGTVGRLAEIKDQATLLRAVNRLRDTSEELASRLRLLIVGDGPLRSDLQHLLEELSLQDLCWMAGNREDIPQLLGAMDIFALPSLGEGISNTILEAMAMGLPIIASDVGGNPELVCPGDNGLIFPAGDPGALAQAIAELCENDEQRESMALRSRARVVQEFNWESTVEAYCEVYDQLLNINRRFEVA
jgi:sugar transferase (PEP-CTERM/EpsH1 system associated)